jgi:hypothetical protein
METLEILNDTPEELHLKSTFRPTWNQWRTLTGSNERYDPFNTGTVLLTIIGTSIAGFSFSKRVEQPMFELFRINIAAGCLAGLLVGGVGIGIVAGTIYLIVMLLIRVPDGGRRRPLKVYTIRLDRQHSELHLTTEQAKRQSYTSVDLSKLERVEEEGASTLCFYLSGKPFPTTFEIEAPQLKRKVYEAITALIASRGEQ